MPHRFLASHFADALGMLLSSMPLGALAWILALGDAGYVNQTIWDQGQLRAWCFFGSLCGAVLAVSLVPVPKPNALPMSEHIRHVAIKLISSLILGGVFTPAYFRWQGYKPDSDMLLMVSCTIAFLGVGVLQVLLPKLPRVIDYFLRKFLPGIAEETPPPPAPEIPAPQSEAPPPDDTHQPGSPSLP